MGGAEVETQNPTDRFLNRATAAQYLYEMTADKHFLQVFEEGYNSLSLVRERQTNQYQHRQQSLCLRYLHKVHANPTICQRIRQSLRAALYQPGNYADMLGRDGYRSYIHDYNWGSNQYKSQYGLFFWLAGEAVWDMTGKTSLPMLPKITFTIFTV